MKRSIKPPEFGGPAGRRVLIESNDWAQQESLARILEGAGYATATCDGPEAGMRCSLVVGSGCSACRDADVVVHVLRHSDARNREVLLEIRRRFPDLPLVVEVPGPRAERYPEDFAGCIVVPQPMTAQHLLDAVSMALDSSAADN